MGGQFRKAMALLGSHPGLLWGSLKGRVAARLPLAHGLREGRVAGGIRFEFPLDADPDIRLMLHGGYEAFTMRVLHRCLAPGDTFIDVGANIGYISAVAAGLVGTAGAVHAFEPVPRLFERLQRLPVLNPGHRFHLNNKAAGEEAGTAGIDVTSAPTIGWNTMVDGFMEDHHVGERIDVEVVRLTDYLASHDITRVALFKIDVEGFEYRVLRGLEPWLAAQTTKPPLLVEIGVDAYPAVGIDLATLKTYVADLGYTPYDLIEERREVDLSALTAMDTVLLRPTP